MLSCTRTNQSNKLFRYELWLVILYFKQTDQVVKEAVLIYVLSEGWMSGALTGAWEKRMITSLECQTEVNEMNFDWLLSSLHIHDIIIPHVSMKNCK